MKTVCCCFVLICLSSVALADTAILRNGLSYSGQFTSASNGAITFTDGQGVQYQFPLRDVQSLVFTSTNDTVTLRSGKVYSGALYRSHSHWLRGYAGDQIPVSYQRSGIAGV